MKRLISILLTVFIAIGCNAGLLYKIEGDALTAPSYIFGTHHMAPLSILDSIAGWHEAFDNAETIVGEIDMTGDKMEMMRKMQPFIIAPADSAIHLLYSKENFDILNIKFAEYTPIQGMDLAALDMLKPAYISSLVAVQIMMREMPEYNPEFQLDTYIQERAVKNGKTIRALETVEDQAEALYNSVPLTVQAEMLAEILDNPENSVSEAKALNYAYMNQDMDSLVSISEKDTDSEFMQTLLKQRNNRWMHQIPEMIAGQKCLIVVGALHLPGQDGLLSLLSDMGYKVSPVK